MSTIISQGAVNGTLNINIDAPSCRTVISNVDMHGNVINIHGEAEKPFIISSRFTECTIIADDLSAFSACYFDQCKMIVKNMPNSQLTSECAATIKNNLICAKT